MKINAIFDSGARNLRPLVALILLSVIGCSGNEPDRERKIIRPAKFIVVEASHSVQTVKYPAITEATSSAEVTFQVGGLIKELARENEIFGRVRPETLGTASIDHSQIQ